MNTLRLAMIVLGLVLAGVFIPGCDEDELKPPTLNCGRDTCAECGMIINEAKFAAAMIVEVDGVRENRMFDDVGDLFDYEDTSSPPKVLAMYVQDYAGGGWVAAETAAYVHNDEIVTPMASGLVAFASRDSAAKAGKTMVITEARLFRTEQTRRRRNP